MFGHSEFVPVFMGKIVRKKLEQPFLTILMLCQSFWEKFGTAIFGHSEFVPVLLGKIVRKKSEWPKMLFQILSDNFSVHITLIECNGLEGNEKFFEK